MAQYISGFGNYIDINSVSIVNLELAVGERAIRGLLHRLRIRLIIPSFPPDTT